MSITSLKKIIHVLMIKKIKTDKLKVGMFIADLNTPWRYHPFFRSSLLIKSKKEIEKIRNYQIDEVYIDTEKGKDSIDAVDSNKEKKKYSNAILRKFSRQSKKEFDKEEDNKRILTYENAKAIYYESLKSVEQIFEKINTSSILGSEKINNIVAFLNELVDGNAESVFVLTKIKNFNQYTYQHSLNVALLSILFGKRLGFPKNELKILGTGALLHDCGIVKIPSTILNKPAKLTDDEYDLIKKHPLHSFNILEKTEGMSRKSLLIALQHHEKYSGFGYPKGLPGYRLSTYSMMVAIADIYDAICTDKPYRRGLTPFNALQKIYSWRGNHLNPKLVDYFIRTVGVYPVGTVLKFKNGFIGIVKRIRDK
ncbi:MAG: HD-GYP domain-containing protein, partial [Candidatus Schekmanbacteria bacterium]